MLGRKLDAELSERLGIANRVVEAAVLAAETNTLARDLALAPPLALARIKRVTRANTSGTLDEALDRERASQLELLASHDLMEGIQAWMQRRAPAFQGK